MKICEKYLQKSTGLWYGGHVMPSRSRYARSEGTEPMYEHCPLVIAYTRSTICNSAAEGWWMETTTVRPCRAKR